MGSENSGFEATFRVLAYAAVVYLVGWIPIIGLLLLFYGAYLLVVGLREVHETSTGRAISVLLLGAFVFPILAVLLIAIVIGIVFVAIRIALNTR